MSKENKSSMFKAYQVAQEMMKDRLVDKDENLSKEFDELADSDVIIVSGTFDHIEDVFRKIGLKHILVSPDAFGKVKLNTEQIVFINCPGNVNPPGLRNLTKFVEDGGFLFTTDWALKHVIEPAFPGYIQYNNRSTGDEVVRVEINAKGDPFLETLISATDDPQWWLEGSSYPITVLDKKKVEVLVKSKEIQKKYGEPAVFVSFDYGKGKIYHMISHFYLQRSETRTERHTGKGSDYLNEKLKMSSVRYQKYANMDIEDSNLGEVESAFTSSAFMNKVLRDKNKRDEENKK